MNKKTQMAIDTFYNNLKQLKLKCLDVVGEDFKINKNYKLIDNEGYLYSLSSKKIHMNVFSQSLPSRFFRKNPYTYENINHWLKLNDTNLELLTKECLDSSKKLKFRHIEYDVTIERLWNNIKAGGTFVNPYNLESVKKMVKDKGAELLSNEYKGVGEKYLFRCECGKTFERKLKDLLERNCTKCRDCLSIHTYDSVREDLANHDIKLLSNTYVNITSNIKVQYSCGFIVERTYGKIKQSNYNCPHCKRKGYTRNTEQFYQEVYDLVGDEYSFEGEFINTTTKMSVTHNTCGRRYEVTPSNFLGGKRCPYCAQESLRKDNDVFLKEVEDIVGNEYTFLENYITSDTKIKVKHSKCGHEYKVTPNGFLNGNRCPCCNSSRSEEEISKYLIEHKIEFESQYIFDELVGVGGGVLRFDFALYNKDNTLFLIEYDGEYHYKPIDGEEHLMYQQTNDRRKDEYCKLHNITLYRIPYWERDNLIEKLEEILEKEGIK